MYNYKLLSGFFLKIFLVNLLLYLVFPARKGFARQEMQPNIILIMADDLGYECIGANGGTSYKTPVIDELARTGIRFEHCYSQPLCTPSRVQIMTGIYNVRNYTQFGVLERNQVTFAQVFRKNGYATCIAGKWQLGREIDSPQHFGFDQSCLWQHTLGRTDEEKHDTRYSNPRLEINGKVTNYTQGEFGPDIVSDFICDFIEDHIEKPFLVYYPMVLTHCPFIPVPGSADWDSADPGSLTYKGDEKYFGAMVNYMDKIVGKLTTKLDESGLREKTLILFTGDNGTDKPVVSLLEGKQVAGGKGLMTDAGTHVPLIANWKGHIPEGKVYRDIVDFSDFFPTLCHAANIPVPPSLNLDGKTFFPRLMGKKRYQRDWIYCWFSRDGTIPAQEWARNQRYKLYSDGAFYDMSLDKEEKNPVQTGDFSRKEKKVNTLLSGVLEQYKDARPQKLIKEP